MGEIFLSGHTRALAFPPPSTSSAVFTRTRLYRHRSPRRNSIVALWAPSSSSRRESPSHDGKRKMFVFGMGFVGRYVSERLMKEEGWEVAGTCTNAVKKKELEEMGFDACLFDATKNSVQELDSMRCATHLLISIPPVAGIGDPLLSMLENLQNNLSGGNLRWLCYLSSTSVYGDYGGAWVNEDYPANPMSDSAKARLVAEQGWLELGCRLGVSSYVLRLGGIYGPGRSALDTIIKDKLLTNFQRMRELKRFTARVHVSDIYQAIKASFDVPSSGRVYNVVDDDPAPRTEVFAFALDLINEKFPGSIEGITSQNVINSAAQEGSVKGEKRVSNTRLKEELGVSLIYPSYKEGLRSILNSCAGSFSPSMDAAGNVNA